MNQMQEAVAQEEERHCLVPFLNVPDLISRTAVLTYESVEPIDGV